MKHVIFGFLVLISTTLSAQNLNTDSLIPRKELFGNPQKATPRLSPNGQKLAYLAPDENNVLNVYVKDLINDIPEVKITQDKKRGIRSYLWHFDNEHIFYVQDKDGDENEHLYLTDLQSKTTQDLTPFKETKVKIIAYNYQYPNQMIIGLNKRDKSLFDVYRLEISSGELTLEMENKENITDFIVDDQLELRALVEVSTSGEEVVKVRENQNAPWKELLRYEPWEDSVSVESFTKDGKSLDLLSSLGSDTFQFIRMNLQTGNQEILFHDPHFDMTSVSRDDKTGEYLSVLVEKEEPVSIPFSNAVKDDFVLIKAEMKEPFFLADKNLNNDKWIIVLSQSDKPLRYYLFDRQTKKSTFLFSTRPSLDQYKMSVTKPVYIKSRDGLSLLSYLTLPLSREKEKLPIVVFVHGGPWARDTLAFNPSVQWLANRGYGVLQVNFRGSTGFGKAFVNASTKEWGAKMQDDLIDAKNWVIAEGIGDPEKIAIFGGSYGGYAALVGLTFTPDAFAVGVDIVGPSNLVTLLQTIPPYWTVQNIENYKRIGNLDTEKEFLQSRSPLFKIDQIIKPLFIAQGANDPRVKQAESDQIVDKMRANGKDVTYLLFPDEGHGFARPENRLRFYAAVEQFLAKYLGGKAEAPTESENWESFLK